MTSYNVSVVYGAVFEAHTKVRVSVLLAQSPWHGLRGWMGVKKQLSIYISTHNVIVMTSLKACVLTVSAAQLPSVPSPRITSLWRCHPQRSLTSGWLGSDSLGTWWLAERKRKRVTKAYRFDTHSSLAEWMNEWMNDEYVNEWSNEWMIKWINEWMTE